MLKSTACFLLALVFITPIQTTNAQVLVGVRGGLSVPDLTGGNNEISEGYTSRLAPNFGVTAEFILARSFSIESQINFDGQGGRRNGFQPITSDVLPPVPSGGYYYADFQNSSILNYIEIPVLAKYTIGLGGFAVHFLAGPYVGYLLNATQHTSGMSQIYVNKNGSPLLIQIGSGSYVPLPPQSFNATTDVTSSINRINAGVDGGAGIDLPVSRSSDISVNVNGLYGMTNIQKFSQDGTSHTGNLIISVGYSMKIFVR